MTNRMQFRVVNLAFAMTMVTIVTMANAGGALANDDKGGDHGPGAGVSASISWDELKARCLHPDQFPVQRAPQNIKIQCADSSYEYVPAAAGQVSLAASRTVVTSVLADKFHVVAGAADVPVIARGGSCLRFKEIEKTLTIEKPMSCNEILGLKTDPAEYCVSALDQARGQNPKLLAVRDTGHVVDTCGALTQSPGRDDGKAPQK